MKKLLLIPIFLMSVLSFSQQIELIDGDYKISKVVEVDASKDDIYKKIKLYLNQGANKSKYVIDVDDPTIGVISYNEITPEYRVSELEINEVKYKVTTEIKDNKFRYTISNIIVEENLMGLKLSKSYSNYLSSRSEDILIKEIDTKLSSEKNERKANNLKADRARNLEAISVKQKMFNDLVDYFETSARSLKSYIEKKDDW